MSNNNAIIAIVIIVILVIGGYFLFAHKASAPTTSPTASTSVTTDTAATSSAGTNASAAAANATASTPTVVTYTDSGFSPRTFAVKLGTTVRFVNNSSHGMWVAVGNHPTHTLYDGTTETSHCSNGTDTTGTFDECKAVDPGTVYSFTFDKAGTFPFHNHVQSSDTGTITVTQ
ncbi:MAG TPA: cupredoxin domain-containing protein [Candidatus Paceibacterota bacterium]|jgi:plastocyanin|nr:cupredoxin domain-containing protein [Candidatus Paceibacterota bacterium]